jgi:hypothetical protein
MGSPVSGASLQDDSETEEVWPGSSSQQRRLVARTVPVRALDRSTITAAFDLFDSLYAGVDRGRFEKDLFEKHLIILLLDPADNVLRGFSTVHVGDVTHAGRSARLVYSGDTAIHPAYWGQKRLQRAFSTVLARQKLRHPTRPLLWFLISKGYKTYLLLVHHCPRSFPRVDRPADARLYETLHSVAHSRFGDAYDPATGVVSYQTARERVRGEVAPIDGPLLGNPHVAFFAARNPGYAQGDELACLAQIRLIDPVTTIARSWWRGRRDRRRFK